MQMEKSRVEKRDLRSKGEIFVSKASSAIAKRVFMAQLVKNLKENSREHQKRVKIAEFCAELFNVKESTREIELKMF